MILITLGSERVDTNFCVYYAYKPSHGNDAHGAGLSLNPFTPESDQSQISPPAPPEILHHTVRRTWLIIAYSDER